MTRKRTYEEIEEIVNELGYKLLGEYFKKRGQQRVIIQDGVGYKYDVQIQNLIRGHVPRIVGKENKFSLYNIPIWIKINKKTFLLRKNNTYDGRNTKLIFKCQVANCLEEFDMVWGNIQSQNQGCPFCSGRRVGRYNNLEYLRKDLMKEWDHEKNVISPSSVTLGSNKYAWWKCSKCKRSWNAQICSRAIDGKGCSVCSAINNGNNLRRTNEEFRKELYDTVENEYSALSDYTGVMNKIKIIHNLCGHIWDVQAGAFLNNGTRCPKCKFTKGERVINRWLTKNKIEFSTQVKFEGCRLRRLLSFDFYLPNYNVCIEYDGEFHYRDVFHNPEEFKISKKRDRIKNKYCNDNSIILLRIPYWEFDNIEKILSQTLFD